MDGAYLSFWKLHHACDKNARAMPTVFTLPPVIVLVAPVNYYFTNLIA